SKTASVFRQRLSVVLGRLMSAALGIGRQSATLAQPFSSRIGSKAALAPRLHAPGANRNILRMARRVAAMDGGYRPVIEPCRRLCCASSEPAFTNRNGCHPV